MPRALAKSGSSGITIMKSRMLTNWIAPIRKMISRSDATRGSRPRSAAAGLLAQRLEVFEGRAAHEAVGARFVADRRGRRLAVVVSRVDPRLLGQAHQPLQAAP